MRRMLLCFALVLTSCSPGRRDRAGASISAADSLALSGMVKAREAGMIRRDLPAVMAQFDSAATFINGGGFYYATRAEIRDFHRGMFENDTLTCRL